MAALLLVYTQHPYYRGNQFAPWRSYYPIAFVLWLVFGVVYVRATLQRFNGTRFLMRDGALHLILLARAIQNPKAKTSPRRLRRSFVFGTASAALLHLALMGANALGHGIVRLEMDVRSYPVLLRTLDRLSVSAGVAGTIFGFAIWLGAGGILGIVGVWAIDNLGKGNFWRMARKPRIRTTCLSILVKAFFTPLMLGFFSNHANNIAEAWLHHKHLAPLHFVPPPGSAWSQFAAWIANVRLRFWDLVPNLGDFSALFHAGSWTKPNVRWGLGLGYDLAFFFDCGAALVGYSLESRWLGNKTRSVEPTALGWAAALSCYPPYNNVLGTYLPLTDGPQIVTSENVLLVFRALIVVLFGIYAAATVSFGFKFSNLTNRGIISRGPYRLVRHPAYACKCTAWWLEHLPTMTLPKAFFLSLLCGIYALRAWTEERHLSMDPDYVAYKRKVPWVLLPGLY